MPFSETMHALADQNRRRILGLLKRGDLSVGEILPHLKMTGASLSHHLAVLKKADLVSSRREGQQIFYTLNLSIFEEIINELSNFIGKDA